MSYCRFSSDNWRSDVYAYEDVNGGYTTHVASNRVVGEIPPDPRLGDLADMPAAEFQRKCRAVGEFLDNAERVPCGGPCDGEVFNDPDAASFLARLEGLRVAGYHVPDRAIARVREEVVASSPVTSPAGQ